MKEKKPQGYWNYDTCKEESKQYKTKSDFQKGSNGAYEVAWRNGWLKEYTWLGRPIYKRKWDHDTCNEEAKKYDSRSQFERNNSAAYNVARKNGWLDEYIWFKERAQNWNYENCKEEASKYTSRKDFKKYNKSAYEAAVRNKWLDEWFEPVKKPSGYWNYDTCKEEALKHKSISQFEKSNARACFVARENGWLDEYDWFEQKQKPSGYWNYDRCKEEALKYQTRNELKHKCQTAYNVALKNKWLDDYDWFEQKQKPSGYWTFDTCLEEAKKYKSRLDFSKKCSGAYHVAQKNGWIKSYDWFVQNRKPTNYWNHETCLEEAKRYKSRKEFQDGSSSAYTVARENGWLDEYIWFKEKPRSWNHDTCLEEAKKYKTRTEFQKACSGAYNVASKNGWLIEYDWLELKRGKWTYDTCKEESKKYHSKKEFQKGSVGAYEVALKNKWIDEYDWLVHPEPFRKWTYETCLEEAMNYTSRGDFQKGNSSAYSVARENDWLKDYNWFDAPKTGKKWTYDTCLEEARKYKLRIEFLKGNGTAYSVARKNGWLDEYDWLEQTQKPRGYWNYENCKAEALKYKSKKEFDDGCTSACQAARDNGWLDEYDWFEEIHKPIGYWNYENCKKEALKYKSRGEFCKNCGSAYVYSLNNGWINDYDWFKDIDEFSKNRHDHCVYAYVWRDSKVAYVGLTHRMLRRHQEHLTKNTPVSRYAQNNGIEIPEPIYLEVGMTYEEGQKKEAYYLDYFKQQGFDMLNTLPAGSIGGYGKGKWNYETCMEESKKYTTRREFEKGTGGAYKVALQNKWLDEYTWLVPVRRPSGYWNYNTCKDEALKYLSCSEFQKGSQVAYEVARTKGWIVDYDWFEQKKKPAGYWTYENCKTEAKKYQSKAAFSKGCKGGYSASFKNGWLDEFFEKKK